jgi:hypothetical protein
VYNLIVEQEEKQIIFYDYNECLLTTWINDLLFSIAGNKFVFNSNNYYENKSDFLKKLKKNTHRCIIIRNHMSVSIENQIKCFSKLGFKNIIVCQNNKNNLIYNIENYRKFLQDNKDLITNCVHQESNYNIKDYNSEISFDDNIFYKSELLLTNFLKWCCIK